MRTTSLADWHFRLGDDPNAWKKSHDESEFRPVRVPHDWSVEHDFDPQCSSGTGYLPGGVGWYRAHASLSALGVAAGQRVRLVFHGVYKKSDVWVNGYHLGGRASGHAEFDFDLTEIIGYAPDDDLVISVRVDRTEIADARWFNGSGITRRVDLEVREQVSLAPHGSTFTTVGADQQSASLDLAHTVVNHDTVAREVELVQSVALLGGRAVHESSQTLTLAAGESRLVHTGAEVDQPALWSHDNPQLHRWVTTVTSRPASDAPDAGSGGDGQTSDRFEQVVGIRTFAFDADHGFSINGDRVVLKGVCLHEDAGPLGNAVPAQVWVRRLLTLKDAGCNAVRMAHNPHAPELYTLCDLLGFYVIDEAFDEWENPKNKWWQGHNVYPPKHEGYASDFPTWHEADLAAMVEVNKNHPSVIAWSIGNEVDYPNDPYASPLFEQMTGNNDANKPAAERVYDPQRPDIRRLTTIANRLIEIVKEHDQTRPVTFAAAFPELSSQTGLLEHLDLVGYNYKEHLYPEDHRRFPDKPLVGSETGHSHQAWRAVADVEYIAGQFLWTGIDYLGETPGWPSHGSGAGLLTTAGFAKERFHLRRSWWADQPVIRVATRPLAAPGDQNQWRPFVREWDAAGGEVEVAVFSNLDQVRASSGDQPIELTWDDELGHWVGRAQPGAEPLRVEGEREGQVVRDELWGRGAPAELRATLWQSPAEVNNVVTAVLGRDDVHQVECLLLDDQGRRATGEVMVSAEVTHGELLGLDNGDLTDTTAYRSQQRSTHQGRLLVHVRGDGAQLTLRPDGLAAVQVNVGDR